MSDKTTERFMAGWSIEKFLDRLPALASIVSGGERLKSASDAELQAWALGIEGATENVKQLIAKWKAANA